MGRYISRAWNSVVESITDLPTGVKIFVLFVILVGVIWGIFYWVNHRGITPIDQIDVIPTPEKPTDVVVPGTITPNAGGESADIISPNTE